MPDLAISWLIAYLCIAGLLWVEAHDSDRLSSLGRMVFAITWPLWMVLLMLDAGVRALVKKTE